MSDVIQRNGVAKLLDLQEVFRIVIVGGARQTGKTTLVREFLTGDARTHYSFDDEATRQRAINDPTGFVDALRVGSSIDEYQRAGEPFLLAVKQRVDLHRGAGQLILTGSASYAGSRSTVETLAGRAGRIALWPLSQGERRAVRETFLDRLFTPDDWPLRVDEPLSRDDVMQLVLEGGFPEVVTRRLPARSRRIWFRSYVGDVVSREALRPIGDVRMERELARLLRLVAARSAQELVIADLARDAELARETTSSYLGLLEALYLVHPLPAWATSATTRAKRRAKIHLLDTGLTADLVGVSERDLSAASSGQAAGPLLESFVVGELQKQATWSDHDVSLSHFRDRNGAEIDVIVEDRDSGRIAGVEVKASASLSRRDTRHLASIRDRLRDRFSVGVVIYTGRVVLPLGERLWALPVSALWSSG